MEFTGTLKDVSMDFKTGRYNFTFTCNESSAVNYLDEIQNADKLSIKAVKFRKKRSLDANALLWLCLGRMAEVLSTDKWSVYLQMLKKYGQYTFVCVKPSVVDAVKQMWRESEEIGEVNINGQKSVQLLCYFGSSTYNTKEFSVLLEGVKNEMQEIGLQPPSSQEMRLALERWEKMNEEVKDK